MSHVSSGLTAFLSICTVWKSATLWFCMCMVPHLKFHFFFFFPGLMFRGLGNGQCWLKAVAGLSDAACRSGSAFKCKRMHVEFFFLLCFIFFFPCSAPYQTLPLNLGASHQTGRGVSC